MKWAQRAKPQGKYMWLYRTKLLVDIIYTYKYSTYVPPPPIDLHPAPATLDEEGSDDDDDDEENIYDEPEGGDVEEEDPYSYVA